MTRRGKVTTHGLNIWPHEWLMINVLADYGYDVEFREESKRTHNSSADIILNGKETWELKSPRGSLKSIERNLKRGYWQSPRVIIYSGRMKNIPDAAIKRELFNCAKRLEQIEHIKFIDRHRTLVDIK